MHILYFDCFAGISGDMTLGALLDLGVDREYLLKELQKLELDGWELSVERTSKNGIECNAVTVRITEDAHMSDHHRHHHHSGEHEHDSHIHRSYTDIVRIIRHSTLSEYAKTLSLAIFKRLANAEGKVHGKPPEDVCFHEVGAVDSIIDIVGTAVCLDWLRPDRVLASVVNDGHGFTRCQHGLIPVPVPAVTEIFCVGNAVTRQIDIDRELVTPTGAAIIMELAESFGPRGEMKVLRTGYGAGTRNLSIPNALRVLSCEAVDNTAESDTVSMIETNVDDCTPEILSYTMERLLEAGAKDVFFTHIQMKKNRPGVMISVICRPMEVEALSEILFSETTTIGVRIRDEHRRCLARESVETETPYGSLRMKKTYLHGRSHFSPEYEDARQLAKANNVPLREIYRASL